MKQVALRALAIGVVLAAITWLLMPGFVGATPWAWLVLEALWTAATVFVILAARGVRCVQSGPHNLAIELAALALGGAAAVRLAALALWPSPLVAWLYALPHVVVQLCLAAVMLVTWRRARAQRRASGHRGPPRATVLWLAVAIGHGIGWVGFFDPDLLAYFQRFTDRSDGCIAQRLVGSVAPWTIAPLLPLAAVALRDSLDRPVGLRWVLAFCGAGILSFGPAALAGLEQPPDLHPWPGFAMPLGMFVAVAIALTLCFRAWLAQLDEDPDESTTS